MTIITGTVKAWATEYSEFNPRALDKATTDMLSFTNGDMAKHGYTLVGEAEITVKLMDHDTLIGNKVEALRAEAANIRAEATMKCTRIEEQINQLLAIEYTPAAPATSVFDDDETYGEGHP